MANLVVVEFIRDCTPYFKGDVATFGREETDQLLNPVLVNENGKPAKVAPAVKVLYELDDKGNKKTSKAKADEAEVVEEAPKA